MKALLNHSTSIGRGNTPVLKPFPVFGEGLGMGVVFTRIWYHMARPFLLVGHFTHQSKIDLFFNRLI
ncbi:MAG: hypothetical protein DPW16_15475 [Chloroflexi bacterium]|nr:hypothetical protein [Chloroflexota bacterium]